MIPTTCISLRMNETAAAEITALAAGAGPPANRIATRRKGCSTLAGRERADVLMRTILLNYEKE